MIIIGEKINSTLKSIRPAIEAYDKAAVEKLAIAQEEAGATFIDVNAGVFVEDEPERLVWLVETVQKVVEAPLAIDSPNPIAMRKGLEAYKGKKRPVLNSLTAEKQRWAEFLPLALEFKTEVVALAMDDKGMPRTVEQRLQVTDWIVENLTREGVPMDWIHIDPLVKPVGTDSEDGNIAIESIHQIKTRYPELHITGGLSNISFGLPARKLMNVAFLIAAMTAGMDGAILDPLDENLMSFVYAGEALLGRDEFCMEYISQYREGLFDAFLGKK